jgi:hypothetical protein
VAQLTAQQHRALDLLAGGSRDSEVARELGVDRTTVWRWRSNDAAFQAELNWRRYELWTASVERLRGLVPSALDALCEELEGPRKLRAAATILELAGFKAMSKSGVNFKPSGAVTAEGIERERERPPRWFRTGSHLPAGLPKSGRGTCDAPGGTHAHA